jgi:site-specific DNA recombinase
MTSAALYARVSSAQQKHDETIASQTAALRAWAEANRLEVPADWVFEDEGHSGATLVRPALEALRDLVVQVPVDVVLCYSPDRLARKFAYQALLIEEFARAGTRVQFVNGPRSNSPEDQLLVQFQGIFAEYEKAQLAERYRRGKAHRARCGSVAVLSGAPFGYRYVRKDGHVGARYEVIAHEGAVVADLFRRYADDGATIADLTRWLTEVGVPTRTGKHLGPLGGLGHAAQPRLCRPGCLRQDHGGQRAGGSEPQSAAGRAQHAACRHHGRPAP